MSKNSLEHLENMMTELIRIVGRSNASFEEFKSDMQEFRKEVKEDIKQLSDKISSLDEDVSSLKEGQAQLFSEVSSLKEGQAQINSRLDKLETRLDRVETRLENEVIDKIRVLFDAREVQNDVNMKILNTLSRLEAKVDFLQLETASIKRIK